MELYKSLHSLVLFDPDTSTYTIQAGVTIYGRSTLTYSSCMVPEHVVVVESKPSICDEHDFFFYYYIVFDHTDTKYAFNIRFDKKGNTWDKVASAAQRCIDDLHKAVAIARKHFHKTQQKSLVDRSKLSERLKSAAIDSRE